MTVFKARLVALLVGTIAFTVRLAGLHPGSGGSPGPGRRLDSPLVPGVAIVAALAAAGVSLWRMPGDSAPPRSWRASTKRSRTSTSRDVPARPAWTSHAALLNSRLGRQFTQALPRWHPQRR